MRNVIYRQNPGFLMREIAGEALLVPVGAQTRILNGMVTLSQTGAFLWKALDGKRDTEDLINLLAEACQVQAEQIAADVIDFLDKAEKNGLVTKV